MIAFTLPMIDGKPLEIIDFKVDFLVSPPEIREQVIGTIEDCLSMHGDFIEVKYKDAVTEEGKLDIYICKLKAGKYRLHILGKIMGEDFRVEKVLFDTSFNCKGI